VEEEVHMEEEVVKKEVKMVQITLPLGTCEEVGTIGLCFIPLGF
jgi:hypothetical protein